jgi:single-stranded-DNA-specific exonuclease
MDMEEKWMVTAKRADFSGLGKKLGLDPVIVRLIRNRDVFTENDTELLPDGRVLAEAKIERYIRGSLEDLYDPHEMKDMDRGCDVILDAIRKGEKIRIIGDYDIDGIMSSYLLLTGLRPYGADVDVKIPQRIRDGYGLNENLVREAAADGVQLIVTCDNGIAAAGQIRLAGELGMRAVVTDHHAVPFADHEAGGPGTEKMELTDEGKYREYLLPPAEAVINPHRADDSYPFDGLCGAGVAYKLICALYDRQPVKDAAKILDEDLQFVAIATIGDVMELVDENRILVREGLKRLRSTENPGLSELIRQNGIEKETVDVYHIGFVIGPCLNASGRLDTAQRALEMLLAGTKEEAAALAGDLVNLNASRKEMTVKGTEAAIELVEKSDLSGDRVLVVFLPDCHESLAGIIAGRLKEHFNRPSFVLTRAEKDEATGKNMLKGSGRSIEAYSMYEELCKCRELMTKFGGHPMAAGISLPEENLEDFRKRLNACCALTAEEMIPKVKIDVPMPVSYIREDLIRQMDVLRPFGNGNPKPLFAQSGMMVRYPKVFGKNRNVCKMKLVTPDGCSMDAVYFGDGDAFVDYVQAHPQISVIYYPGIDTWKGRNTLQVTISSYR